MSLVPVSGPLSTAQAVAKADPGTLPIFLELSLFEAMTDLYDDALEEVEPDVLGYMESRVAKARATLLRQTISKALDGGQADTSAIAEGLAVLDRYVEISKDGLVGTALSIFNQQHPRDSKGRFIRSAAGRSTSPEQPLGTRNQGHIQEVGQAVGQWQRAGMVSDDTQVQLHFARTDDKGRMLGNRTATHVPVRAGDARNKAAELLAEYETAGEPRLLAGVSVARSDLNQMGRTQRRAAANLLSMATDDPDDFAAINTVTRPLDRDQDWGSAARNWNRPTSTDGSDVDRQSFRRMQVVGRALSAVSAPGSTADTIGGVAQLVGDLGPEAERVLGPGMRRTAYRYRGTERRADPSLVKDMERVGQAGVDQLLHSRGDEQEAFTESLASVMEESALRRGAGRRGTTIADIAADRTLAHWHGQSRVRDMSEDQIAMRTRGDIAAVTMLDSVPSMEETELSVAAGELPPSIGVMIDRDGDVASQAQGYNGDHYLPFDLKNLKRLRGGQYVRTRAAGGPTTEDFYTALMTGARQFDVVSNSGVFTVEFDPDVRGGRRYSDRALRMVQRYGQMLEAISSSDSQLFLTDLPPATKARIRNEALEEAGNDRERFQQIYRERLGYERFRSEVSPEDYEELESTVDEVLDREVGDYMRQNRGARMPRTAMAARRRELMGQMIGEEQADKVRRLQLDGPGYYRAMRTLQQEFPFFIREVDFATVPDWLARRNLTKDRRFRQFAQNDPGYTRPGQVTAAAAQANGAYQVNGQRRQRSAEGEAEVPAAGPASTSTSSSGQAPTSARSTSPAPSSASAASGGRQTLGAALSPDNRRAKLVMETGLGSLHAAVTGLGDQLPAVSTDSDAKEAYDIGQSPGFLRWHMTRHGTAGSSAPKVAQWLLGEASDSEAEIFRDGLENHLIPAIKEQREMSPTWPSAGYNHQAVLNLVTLMDMRKPYSESTDVTDNPNAADPKPMRFSEIPDSVDPADFDQALTSWDKGGRNPQLAKTITEMQGDSTEDIVDTINDSIETVTEMLDEGKRIEGTSQLRDLTNQQMAWSFIRGRQIAQSLNEMGVVRTGDADPKALSKSAGPRRRVVIRKRGTDELPQIERLRELLRQ